MDEITQSEAITKKWNKWLDHIDSEVSELYQNRRIYHDLTEIIDANPRINGGNWLYAWMFGNYAQAAAASIRRLLDGARKDPISLKKLIENLCKHPDLIKRYDFVAQYHNDEYWKAKGHQDFDKLAGMGCSALDPAVLVGELQQAEVLCAKVQTYVDKAVAHHDKDRPIAPTYKELDEAIEAVGKLFQHLYAILRCTSRELEIVLAHPWKWVLDEPWVRDKSLQTQDYPGWSDWLPLTTDTAESAPDSVFSVIRVRTTDRYGKPHGIHHKRNLDTDGIVFIGTSGFEKEGFRRNCTLPLYVQALVRAIAGSDEEWEGPRRMRLVWQKIQLKLPTSALEIQYLPLGQYLQTEAVEMRVRTEFCEDFAVQPEETWLHGD